MEKIVGKQVVFSLNNGWSKYFQRDVNSDPATKELVQNRQETSAGRRS
jgi:hypothetical protein